MDGATASQMYGRLLANIGGSAIVEPLLYHFSDSYMRYEMPRALSR